MLGYNICYVCYASSKIFRKVWHWFRSGFRLFFERVASPTKPGLRKTILSKNKSIGGKYSILALPLALKITKYYIILQFNSKLQFMTIKTKTVWITHYTKIQEYKFTILEHQLSRILGPGRFGGVTGFFIFSQ